MKLSEISILLDFLKQANPDPAYLEYFNKLYNIHNHLTNHSLQIGTVSHDLTASFNDTVAANRNFTSALAYLEAQLRQVIVQREPEYYANSSRLYEEEMRWDTNDHILNRRLVIDHDSNLMLRNRIKLYTDWRLPGMIIRPGLETHIEDLVPLDPLYVLDQHEDLIMPAITKFTAEYQRRLRPYVINDYTNEEPLHDLPDQQFGLIFAYNFLNYKPIEVVQRYLRDFYRKLRPGGVVLFTFNNCDLSQGMGLAEKYFMCYTPGHRVLDIAMQFGFENLHDQQGPNDVSWLELKKPGDITSLRGGQTLARIVRK